MVYNSMTTKVYMKKKSQLLVRMEIAASTIKMTLDQETLSALGDTAR